MSHLYILTSAFMLIIIGALQWQMLLSDHKNSPQKDCVALTVVAEIYIILDALFASCFVHTGVDIRIFRAVCVCFFISYVTLPLTWCRFAQSVVGNLQSGWQRILFYIPYAILLLMIVIGSYGHRFLWVINDQVRYGRGSLFEVFTILNLFYYVVPICQIGGMIFEKKKKTNSYLLQILVFSAIPVLGIVTNTYLIPLKELYPFQPFCILVGILCAYFFIVEKQYNEESLEKTKMLEEALEREKESKHYALMEERKVNQYRKAIVSGAAAVYEVNLSKDILESVVLKENGKEEPQERFYGRTIPCRFSEFLMAASLNMTDNEKAQFFEKNDTEFLISCFLKGKLELQIEYDARNPDGKYLRMRKNYVLTRDGISGNVFALIVLKDISEKYEQKRMQELQMQSQLEVIEALGSEFSSIYKVDFKERRITKLSSNGQFSTVTDKTDVSDDYDEIFRIYTNVAIHPEDRERFLKEVNLEHVMECLRRNRIYDLNYRRVVDGAMDYAQLRFMKVGGEHGIKIICAVRSVDELMKKEKEQQEELGEGTGKGTGGRKGKIRFSV